MLVCCIALYSSLFAVENLYRMSRAIQHGYESKSAMICGFDPLCFVYRLTGLRGTGVFEHVPATSNLFALSREYVT